MSFQKWYLVLLSFHGGISKIVLMGQIYLQLNIPFTQSATTEMLLTCLTVFPLMKIHGNREEVSDGDTE